MKLVGLVLLVLASIVSYFVLATEVGITQRYPVVHFAVCIAAVVTLAVMTVKRFSLWRLASLVVAAFFSYAFFWYTLDYSGYAARELKVAAGASIGTGLVLTSAGGEATPVLAPAARATLVVLYRGYW